MNETIFENSKISYKVGISCNVGHQGVKQDDLNYPIIKERIKERITANSSGEEQPPQTEVKGNRIPVKFIREALDLRKQKQETKAYTTDNLIKRYWAEEATGEKEALSLAKNYAKSSQISEKDLVKLANEAHKASEKEITKQKKKMVTAIYEPLEADFVTGGYPTKETAKSIARERAKENGWQLSKERLEELSNAAYKELQKSTERKKNRIEVYSVFRKERNKLKGQAKALLLKSLNNGYKKGNLDLSCKKGVAYKLVTEKYEKSSIPKERFQYLVRSDADQVFSETLDQFLKGNFEELEKSNKTCKENASKVKNLKVRQEEINRKLKQDEPLLANKKKAKAEDIKEKTFYLDEDIKFLNSSLTKLDKKGMNFFQKALSWVKHYLIDVPFYGKMSRREINRTLEIKGNRKNCVIEENDKKYNEEIKPLEKSIYEHKKELEENKKEISKLSDSSNAEVKKIDQHHGIVLNEARCLGITAKESEEQIVDKSDVTATANHAQSTLNTIKSLQSQIQKKLQEA